MKVAKAVKAGAILLVCAFPIQEANAANPYADGCRSYSQGDYRSAEGFFKQAAAAYPNNALVHYQLANSAMGLHKRAEAKAEYNLCLQLRPDAAVAASCQKMLAFFNSASASHEANVEAKASKTEIASKVEAEKEERKQAILRKANAEAAAIRAETEKMIAEGGVPGNQQIVQNRETGEIKLGVTSAQAEAMREEANERANKVLVAGKDRAMHL